MKKMLKLSFALILLILLFSSCQKKDEIDKEKPQIDVSFDDAFPKNCDTLYFGESHIITLQFSDNVELGSFNISIHNNFDHHSHTTETAMCVQDPVKTPVNPYSYIQDFSIPPGTKSYKAQIVLNIPTSNQQGFFDEGDYHFFISLTDRSGWSTVKGLSIKMKRR